MNRSLLEIARFLLALRLSVIPVPRSDGRRYDGKVPAIAWREYQKRLPTDDEIREWFGTDVPMNIAVVTGAVSNIIVVDADEMEGVRHCTRRLPYTPWQTRTKRGFHLWYRYPGVEVRNRARIETPGGRLAIDVRGDGGYVIGPGSVHASGALYEFAGDWTREDVPRFWPGWLQRPVRPSTPSPLQPRLTGDVVDRARAYLAAIPQPQIGAGSDAATLYAAARLTRGFGLSEHAATDLLWEWCGGRPGWTRAWVARKVANAMRYGTEPVGALR